MSLRETLLKMEERGKPSKQEIDAQLKEWRKVAIPGLYQNIKDMLSDLIADGLISVSPPCLERRTEELTGPCDIEVMDLAMRGRTITVNPMSLFTAGARARAWSKNMTSIFRGATMCGSKIRCSRNLVRAIQSA